MLRLTVIVLIVLLVAYLGLCIALFIFQRSLIYFPRPRSANTATLALPTDGGSIVVSTRQMEGQKAVIYFGGNAEDVSASIPELSAAFPDRAVYAMHYRGYGGSFGRPYEEGLVQDGLKLYDEVSTSHKDIAIVGRSLGSGIAIQMASQRPVSRLVLVSPFNSLGEIAARQFPYLPVGLLLQDKYESWRYAPHVKAPTLIIAAEHDELIPPESSERLLSHFVPGIASYKVVPGAGHNTISFSPEYLTMLKGN